MNENFTDDDSSLLYLLPNNPPSLQLPQKTHKRFYIHFSQPQRSDPMLCCLLPGPLSSSPPTPLLFCFCVVLSSRPCRVSSFIIGRCVLSSSRIYYLIILKILSIIILHTTTMRERGAATDTPYSSPPPASATHPWTGRVA